MKKRALISVSDKKGIAGFAAELAALGYEIISTGNTARVLVEAGIPAVNVSEVTGFPECLDGRVKTLHPALYAGILARRGDAAHMETLSALSVSPVELVCINLYPFKETVQKPGSSFEDAIENIDIGGPSMLRAAAKNHEDVYAVTDPDDYPAVIAALRGGGDPAALRLALARKVFEHTAAYDALISDYLRSRSAAPAPEKLTLTFEKAAELRYGENPHQKAVFYKDALPCAGALANAEQLWGKELSFNNYNDAEGALALLREFSEPCAVAVKHANPCGVGVGEDISEAYENCLAADPVSIFGGIVALNREVDEKTARRMAEIFLEVVIAPAYSEGALEALKTKPNLRVLLLPGIRDCADKLDFRRISGGLLVTERDGELLPPEGYRTVTKKAPEKSDEKALLLAWKVVKHTKSNAIVVANEKMTLGIGPGQTNRIGAAKIALAAAGEKARGAVMASDAFFPFDDCAAEAARAGIAAVIQPGGSIRDGDSIRVCDENGVAMVFTGMRHFRH